MKRSWAVFKLGCLTRGYGEDVLILTAGGFHTERQAKKYIQHPDNQQQGSFVVLEVIEMSKEEQP